MKKYKMEAPVGFYESIKEKLCNMAEKLLHVMIEDADPETRSDFQKQFPDVKSRIESMEVPLLMMVATQMGKYVLTKPVPESDVTALINLYKMLFKNLCHDTEQLMESMKQLRQIEGMFTVPGSALLTGNADMSSTLVDFVQNSNAIEKMCEKCDDPEIRKLLHEKLEKCREIYNEYHNFFKELFHIKSTVDLSDVMVRLF